MSYKTIFLTLLTDQSTADTEGVGTLREEGARFFRWVQNKHTSALVAGQPVCYKIAAAYYEKVYQPVSADLNTLAGIAMSAIAADSYGWIEIEGYYGSIILSLGKTSIAAGINAFPADTVDYLVGGAQQSLTQASEMNQMVGRVQLAVSIASSAGSGGGTSAGTTAVGGFIHCLHV